MTREVITPRDEAHWLDLRRQDVTSTGSAALFGLSPYVTRFELYHQHVNGLELPFKDNDRVGKGRRLEAAIADEAALQEGWADLKPLKDYIRDPDARMGASFDFEALDADGKPLLIEIKMVDFFRYRDLWIDGEAPEHIEVQVQHQLEVADRFDRAAIVAWTGTYDCNVIYRDRDREMGAGLRAAVAAFWDDCANLREPAPDFHRDLDMIAAINRGKRSPPADMTGDDSFDQLVARMERWKATEKEAKAEADACKAEIHHIIGSAEAAFTDRFKVTTGWTKDTPDRVAEPGEIIKGRSGYRQCLIKDLTAKEEK